MEYRIEQDTPSYLCDRHDRLHLWAAVRLCQEVSEYHSNSTGVGFEQLMQTHRAWVIARSYYMIYRRPKAFERIMLSTWYRGNDGLFAFRDYRMTTPEGEVLLTGTSYWPLIDFDTRRAIRLKDTLSHEESYPVAATDREALGKLVPPEMSATDQVATRQVVHSMLDHTQHVNNSEYIKLVFDTLDATHFDSDHPFSIEMNFQHESKLDETLSVWRKTIDNTDWFQIFNSRGIAAIAKIY